MEDKEKIIERLRKVLMLKYPRFAGDIASKKIVFSNNIVYNSLAMTDSENIYLNEQTFPKLSPSQQLFIVAHEYMHVKFEHVKRIMTKDGKFRDPLIWNIATDAIINANLVQDGLEMVEGGIDIEESINYSAEEFYDHLIQEAEETLKKQEAEEDEKSDLGDPASGSNDNQNNQDSQSNEHGTSNNEGEQNEENSSQNTSTGGDSQSEENNSKTDDKELDNDTENTSNNQSEENLQNDLTNSTEQSYKSNQSSSNSSSSTNEKEDNLEQNGANANQQTDDSDKNQTLKEDSNTKSANQDDKNSNDPNLSNKDNQKKSEQKATELDSTLNQNSKSDKAQNNEKTDLNGDKSHEQSNNRDSLQNNDEINASKTSSSSNIENNSQQNSDKTQNQEESDKESFDNQPKQSDSSSSIADTQQQQNENSSKSAQGGDIKTNSQQKYEDGEQENLDTSSNENKQNKSHKNSNSTSSQEDVEKVFVQQPLDDHFKKLQEIIKNKYGSKTVDDHSGWKEVAKDLAEQDRERLSNDSSKMQENEDSLDEKENSKNLSEASKENKKSKEKADLDKSSKTTKNNNHDNEADTKSSSKQESKESDNKQNLKNGKDDKENSNDLRNPLEKDEFEQNRKQRIEFAKKHFESLKKNFSSAISKPQKTKLNVTGVDNKTIDWRLLIRRQLEKEEIIWSQRRSIAENNYAYRLEDYEDEHSVTQIMIDSSGSVQLDDVKAFLRMLKPLLKDSEMFVGCFDTSFYGFTKIKKESDIENFELYGRGGTDFDNAIVNFSKDLRVNKIVFTDGFCPQNVSEKYLSNIIWIVYQNKNFAPKCGKVINISLESLIHKKNGNEEELNM